jgi:hypothetical protein
MKQGFLNIFTFFLTKYNRRIILIVLYFIQHPPFDSIVSEDAGIEHKTVATTGRQPFPLSSIL